MIAVLLVVVVVAAIQTQAQFIVGGGTAGIMGFGRGGIGTIGGGYGAVYQGGSGGVGGPHYRVEPIVSADYVTRPLDLSNPNIASALSGIGIEHHGVKVHTKSGNDYLLHSTPSSGMVATQAPMSSDWKVDHSIPVTGTKTVGDTMHHGTAIKNGLTNFVTGGACVGAAHQVENFLKK
jgi:hypothetical protein